VENPWDEISGIKVGAGCSDQLMLGSKYYFSGMDFCAVYGNGTAIIIDIDRSACSSSYDRWIFSVDREDALIVKLMQATDSVGRLSNVHNIRNTQMSRDDRDSNSKI
jgi:hypothetical protein